MVYDLDMITTFVINSFTYVLSCGQALAYRNLSSAMHFSATGKWGFSFWTVRFSNYLAHSSCVFRQHTVVGHRDLICH